MQCIDELQHASMLGTSRKLECTIGLEHMACTVCGIWYKLHSMALKQNAPCGAGWSQNGLKMELQWHYNGATLEL